jgi:hypothetical protein
VPGGVERVGVCWRRVPDGRYEDWTGHWLEMVNWRFRSEIFYILFG